MQEARQEAGKNPPIIRGDEPVEQALQRVAEHLGMADRQAVIHHLARVCWAGPLERWLREPEVVDLEVGNSGTVIVRRADGTLQVTEQKLSPEWIEFLVRLWREPASEQPEQAAGWQGEVEHIQSGQRSSFEGLDQLFASIRRQVEGSEEPE